MASHPNHRSALLQQVTDEVYDLSFTDLALLFGPFLIVPIFLIYLTVFHSGAEVESKAPSGENGPSVVVPQVIKSNLEFRGHLYHATTAHARFLPSESKHTFSYPLLYFGVWLDELERGRLNLKGRWFEYFRGTTQDAGDVTTKRKRWCWTSLTPAGYMNPTPSVVSDPMISVEPERCNNALSSCPTIKQRLHEWLRSQGIEPMQKAAFVYMVTMPAFIGYEGINPLSIHFCYSMTNEKCQDTAEPDITETDDEWEKIDVKGSNSSTPEMKSTAGRRAKLEVVVLEVHNTFGERHCYLLEIGAQEDAVVAKGFQYQWTFPRAFHVSPFNDRTGFYRVSLSDPFNHRREDLKDDLNCNSASAHDHSTSLSSDSPYLSIKIVFLTASLQKKIYASLVGPSVPLTEANLRMALWKFPFTLLATLPRILWQAMKLHYNKKLDVFPRPEPHVDHPDIKLVNSHDLKRDEILDLNPVERGGKAGNVGWQDLGWFEMFARKRVVSFLVTKVKEMAVNGKGRNIKVNLIPSDINQKPIVIRPIRKLDDGIEETALKEEEVLTIRYLTPLFFTDLFVSPSMELALSIGSLNERRWFTTNDKLFLEVFTPLSSNSTQFSSTRGAAPSRFLRRYLMEWGLSFAEKKDVDSISSFFLISSPSLHPLDLVDAEEIRNGGPGLWVPLAIGMHILILRLGYWAFILSRARFVEGMETWGDWARFVDAKSSSAALERSNKGSQSVKEHGSVIRRS